MQSEHQQTQTQIKEIKQKLPEKIDEYNLSQTDRNTISIKNKQLTDKYEYNMKLYIAYKPVSLCQSFRYVYHQILSANTIHADFMHYLTIPGI